MIKVDELNSGVRLVSEYIPHVQSVSIGIWVKAGSVNEEVTNAGISHYIEHMLFKGTERRSAKDIAQDADRIAGQLNAFTGREATCFYIKTMKSNTLKGLDLLLDIFQNAIFDPEEMAKERNVILEEIKMVEDSPEDDIHDMITDLVFNDTALGRPIAGNAKSLSNIDRSAIIRYREKRYIPGNIVISISGNYDEDEVRDYLNDNITLTDYTVHKAALGRSTEFTPWFRTKTRNIEQSHIAIATPSISRTHPLYDAMAVVNNILGGSMSSRLFQSIREERGLAYSVYSLASSFTDEGYFCIYAGVAHDKVEECTEGIRGELMHLDKYFVTNEEISMSKEQIKGSFIYGIESINNRMYRNGQNLLLDDLVIENEEIIDRINKVRPDEIKEAINMISDIGTYSGACISDRDVDLRKLLND